MQRRKALGGDLRFVHVDAVVTNEHGDDRTRDPGATKRTRESRDSIFGHQTERFDPEARDLTS